MLIHISRTLHKHTLVLKSHIGVF